MGQLRLPFGDQVKSKVAMGRATIRVRCSSQEDGNYNIALKTRGEIWDLEEERENGNTSELSNNLQFLMLYLSYREPQFCILC